MQRHPASVRTLRLSVDSRNVFSVLPRALHVISGSLSCYSSSSATSVSNLAQADASTDGCERFTRFSSVQDAVVCEHRRARRYARVARGHVRDSWWRELLLPAARKIRVRRESERKHRYPSHQCSDFEALLVSLLLWHFILECIGILTEPLQKQLSFTAFVLYMLDR